jgi:Uma2 family endonuclease
MPAERSYVPVMPVPMTADDLLHANISDKRTELLRGVLVVREPAGGLHGVVAMRLGIRLGQYVERTGAGYVFAAETGFRLTTNPDTVRAPDVAFVRGDRLPGPALRGFPGLAPDLVVEVLSPDDRPTEVSARIADWLSAGTRLVWVVDPERRLAHVHRPDRSASDLTIDDALEGEDVLPGFACPLATIVQQ